MSAEEVPNRADAVGAFESEEVGGGEAAISVSKENYADRKVSFTERSEYDTEIETISHTKEEGGEHTKEEGGEHTKEERGEHTKEKRGDEGSRTEEEIEEQKEESLLGSHENVHEDNSGSLVKCVSNSYDVEAQVENESQQISPSESQNNAGFLPWEEDIQMLSAFSDKKVRYVCFTSSPPHPPHPTPSLPLSTPSPPSRPLSLHTTHTHSHILLIPSQLIHCYCVGGTGVFTC